MRSHVLGQSGLPGGVADGLLDHGFVYVMPVLDTGVLIDIVP